MKTYEEFRRKQFIEFAFWMSGPVASLSVIFACTADMSLYPETWTPSMMFVRLFILVPSIVSMILLKRFPHRISPEVSTLIVPSYIVGFHCYFISITGFEKSEYYNALVQLVLALSIVPFTPFQFILMSGSTLLAYVVTILGGDHLSLNHLFEIRHMPTFITYFVLIYLVFFVLHKFRKATFLAQQALESELISREERISSMVSRELANRNILAKAQLAGQVAHDLRSPIGSLRVALLKSKKIEGDVHSLLTNSVDRVTEIADTLLDQYRSTKSFETAELTSDTLHRVVDGIIIEKRELFSKEIKLKSLSRTNLNTPLPREITLALKRILSNLLDNSAEALSGPGTIRVTYLDVGSKIILRIRDSGPGLPMHSIKNIFSGASFGKGRDIGIGLKHSQKLVVSLGGLLSVRNGPSSGAVITIEIPTRIQSVG
jgi:signal transduction histidine kinase